MIVLKNKFNFGDDLLNNKGCIYFKRSRSNFFITLTDLNHKVIICKTSGSVLYQASKRRKKSPQAIEDIMKSIRSYIKLYNITCIIIILRQRLSIHIKFIVKELEIYNIPILHFKFKLCRAFNGMRQRKLRRL